jgi:hypothetical protein
MTVDELPSKDHIQLNKSIKSDNRQDILQHGREHEPVSKQSFWQLSNEADSKMRKSQYHQRLRSFTSLPMKLTDEIASTEASELHTLPVSTLEVSGSIIHSDTATPTPVMQFSSVSQPTPGPFHTFPIIHTHHSSRATLKTHAAAKFVELSVACKKARYIKLLNDASYMHLHFCKHIN